MTQFLSLQVDYDQVQDECEYYRHKNSELEHNLEAEKKMKLEAEEQKQVKWIIKNVNYCFLNEDSLYVLVIYLPVFKISNLSF